jgi:hypothetical protein
MVPGEFDMTIPDYDKECDCDLCQQLRKERNEYYDNLHKERNKGMVKNDLQRM